MHRMEDQPLSPIVRAARDELQNPRILSDRIAVGRALWRELVIGFAHQLGSLDIGFTKLAALYAVGGPVTLTVPSAGVASGVHARRMSYLDPVGKLPRVVGARAGSIWGGGRP